jgi:hypothetical protein
MVTDYKIGGVDRPGIAAASGPNLNSGNGRGIDPKAIRDNVEAMGRSVGKRVGSWYRRRVRTPVEQLSSDLGLDGFRIPKGLPFGSSNSSRNSTPKREMSPGSSNDARNLDRDEVDQAHVGNTLEQVLLGDVLYIVLHTFRIDSYEIV